MATTDRDDRDRDEQQDQALRAMAAAVVGRGLEAPAIFLLEAVRPLHLLVEQAFLVSHPILSPVLGERLLLWASLFADARAIERLQTILAGQDGARWPGLAGSGSARQGRV